MAASNGKEGAFNDEQLLRRIKAAKELAGITSTAKLAQKMGEKGLRRTTLYKIEQNKRPAQTRDLRAIAAACDLPFEWFYADFQRAAEIAKPEPGPTRSGAVGVPRIPGVTGRRVGEDDSSAPDQSQPGSTPEADAPTGTDE